LLADDVIYETFAPRLHFIMRHHTFPTLPNPLPDPPRALPGGGRELASDSGSRGGRGEDPGAPVMGTLVLAI